MPGLFSRIKTWVVGENLTASDLNNEFDNIITNFEPEQMDSYSKGVSPVAQMQATTDPGEPGSEVLATSLAGELERLRFAITEIKGTSEWYESPITSLDDVNAALGTSNLLPSTRIISGRSRTDSSQPIFLVPDGLNAEVDLLASATNLKLKIDGVDVTYNTDITLGSLVTAPNTNNTMLINDTTLTGQEASKYIGEQNTELVCDATGSEIAALDGRLAAFKVNNGVDDEYFIAYVKSSATGAETRLTHCYRGYFFDSSDLPIERITINNNDTITLMELGWIFAKNDGTTLTPTYNPPFIQPDSPTSPNAGDFWFDTTEDTWKSFNGTIFVNADAVLIGNTIQDDTKCVAVRSFDFHGVFEDKNNMFLEKVDNASVRTIEQGSLASVYGTLCDSKHNIISWGMPGDLESGQAETANTTYYLYLSQDCDTIISETRPYNRKDLRGLYHPYHTWRCIGSVENDGSSDFDVVQNFGESPMEFLSDSADGSFGNSFSTSATVSMDITTPRPVLLGLNGTGASSSYVRAHANNIGTTCEMNYRILRNGTIIGTYMLKFETSVSNIIDTENIGMRYHPGLIHVDLSPPTGKVTYEFQAAKNSQTDTATVAGSSFYALQI